MVFFPEGTTSNGEKLLPFRGMLFEAALRAGVPVQPVALRYPNPHGSRIDRAVLFIEQDSLVGSIWRLAGAREIRAEVELLPPIPATGNRRELAEAAQAAIAKALRIPVRADEPTTTEAGAQ